MDALLAKVADAYPPAVIEVLAANIDPLARAMADEVSRTLPHVAADSDVEALARENLEIAYGALRERRPLTAQEADRMNAIWGHEIATHGWTLDDVVQLNRVIALAGWEASIPLLAQVSDADRARVGELAPLLVHAVDATGPYVAGTYAAASERLAAERREQRRRFAKTALSGARSEGDVRRQARDLGVPLAASYVVASIRAPSELATDLRSVAATQWEARLGDDALLAEMDDAVVVALPIREDEEDKTASTRVRRVIREGLSALGGKGVAGLSASIVGIGDLPRGMRESSATAELLERTDAPGTVASFSERLVDHIFLADPALLQRLIEDVLGPVLKERSAAALLQTLDAYFASDGNASRVATTLSLHRHTIDYRISRLRDLLGREQPLTRPEVLVAVVGYRLLRTFDERR